jgi:C4-dicarboxylate-specific signal transduction histidine kinase
MSPLRILLLEDNSNDAKLIQELLQIEDRVSEVIRVQTREEFVTALETGEIELILSDYKLPSFDGLSALKFALIARPEIPFIFVSGALGEEPAIEALKIGATDYVLKTRLSRLVPAVERALREARERAERKKAEEALRRSEMYLAEAQKLSLTGSFGWNVSSGEIFWSEQSFRIFEYDPATPPTIEGVLQRTHPDDVALVQQELKQAIDAREDFDFEHRLLMPEGSIKHLHVVAHAVKEDTSKLQYFGAIKDITATRRAEEQLHETRAELARVGRATALGELSASIAHEVGQPLAAIVTHGEACLQWLGHATPQLDEVQACVQQMIAAGMRAGEIVRRIRTLTQRETARKALLDLNDIVNEVASLIQHDVFRHRVSMRLNLAPDLPPRLGDRIELQQVILNLVINGIQAIDNVSDGPRELLIETRQDEQGDVVAAVQDSGTGIKPESANRIFDPFFTTKPEGMGMGLSICRSIIESHGGRLWAANHTGRGAIFQFSLPPICESEASRESSA